MFFRIIEYFRYFFIAKSRFSIHAPFAYEFYTKVIQAKVPFPQTLDEIEVIRRSLLKSKGIIVVTDFGTGSQNKVNRRKVSDIVRSSSNSKKDSFLLFRMIEFLKPRSIVELGTSFGISTMYIAKAGKSFGKIISVEGCPEIAQLARENFIKTNLPINLITGNIDLVLPEMMQNELPVDFILFDANHTKEATLRYFNICLPHADENTVFVFHDIYWSMGMKEAWQEIVAHPEITLSIDLYQMGIVFFKKNSFKQHFVLKY
jgi:predicted O-methyltransferase YrrM